VARTNKNGRRKSSFTIVLWSWKRRLLVCDTGEKTSPRTARLLAGGLPRIAQKLAEEATEVVIEAVRGERSAVINEGVDLIYNLVVLWSELGITASEIWAEMDRRQAVLGMAEKLPKENGIGSTSSAGH
jgi:phosphoribosyl-ATP pyrophosphohydrolase